MVGVKPLTGWLTGAMFLAVAGFQLGTLINPSEIEILKTSFSGKTVASAVKRERVHVAVPKCHRSKLWPRSRSEHDDQISQLRVEDTFRPQQLHSMHE